MSENVNPQQLIDALGRVMEVAPKAGDALGALAEAMNAAVTKITTATSATGGGSKAVVEFIDLIDDKESKVKKFAEYLKDEMPTAFKTLAEDIEKVKTGLQETAAALDQIKKNSGGGGGGGGGGSAPKGGDSCPCETLLSAMSTNISTISTTMTGRGIKLEAAAMDILRTISRRILVVRNAVEAIKVGGGGGGGGSYPLPRMPATPPAPTPPASGEGLGGIFDTDLSGAEERLGSIFDTASEGASGLSKDMDALLDQWMKYVRNLSWATTHFNEAVASSIEKMQDSDDPAILKQAKKLERSHHVLEGRIQNILQNEREIDLTVRRQLRKEMLLLKVMQEQGASADELAKQYDKVYKLTGKISRNIMAWKALDGVAGMLAGALGNFSRKVVGGMLSDLNEWEKEATNMAATMTGGIHKAGGATQELVGHYRDLLQVSDAVVRDAHQFPAVIRREWTKAIKKGTRSIAETKATINAGLAAAWQVGASAEATTDEFQKWNMNLGMSVNGATSLARTMVSVSKTTGVMGDNLLQAVSAAREIAQLMRDTGIYSQQTANSIVGWMASAQKFGVDKQVQQIFRASQGGLEAFNEASAETRNLLASSGQLQNVLGGNADPEAVMSGVGDAIRAAIPAHAFARRDARGRPAGLPDLKKLSRAEIARLDLIMKRRFGMKLGEATRLLESIQDQNPAEKLEQINRDLNNPTLTAAEKEALELQKKQLQIAIEEKELAKNLDSMAELSDSLKNLPADGAARTQALNRIFQQNKVNEATFRSATDNLGKKLERQGTTFEAQMGMSQQAFNQRMTQLLQQARSGDNNAIREFRELQQKLADANKKADSEAKNNSNNADKMESDQQHLQNQLQNLAKPLHTMAMQAPIWTWYLAMIAGALWMVYRWWAKGRLSENMALTAQTLVSTIGTKGSGWVHDPYVEHFVKNIDKNLVGLGKHLTKGKFGGKKAEALKDNTATKAGEESPMGAVSGFFGGLKDRLGNMLSPVTDKLKEKFSTVGEGMKAQFGKLFDGQSRSLKDGFKHVFGVANESVKKGFSNTKDVLTGKMKPGELLSKGAPAGPAAAAPAAITQQATQAPVVQDAAKNLDKAKAVTAGQDKVAKAQGGLAKAEGAKQKRNMSAEKRERLLLRRREMLWKREWALLKRREKLASRQASRGGMKGKGDGPDMKVPGKEVKGPKAELPKPQMKGGDAIMKGAAKIAAIAAAVVALGVILILAAKAIMKLTGFDAKQAQEVAWVLGTVIGAGAGALLAAAAAAKVMEWANKTIKKENIKDIYMGGLMLLAILPAVMLLGLVLVGLGALLSLLISPKKAEEYAWAVGNIMLAAGVVALAVLMAAASMTILGLLVPVAEYILPFMLLGAIAILVLTPAMMALAAAVLGMAALMNKLIDPKWATGVAKATADIMLSAATVAGAVVGAAAALLILSVFYLLAWILVPLMTLGAIALLALIPAMLALAWAVIKMAQLANAMVDVKWAQKVAKDTADIMQSAGKITGAVVASAGALMGLSIFYMLAWILIPLMAMGAIALLALTPAVIKLAVAIINMATRMAGADKAKEGKDAAKNLSEVLDSAAKIADAIVKSKEKLESLAPGWNIFSLFGIKRDTFGEGAQVLNAMTPRVVLLAKAIINMATQQTAGNIVKEGQDAAKNLASVLESAAKITKSVVDSKKQLEDIGSKSFIGWAWSFFKGDPLAQGAETLQVMTPQTVLLAKAIIDMAQRMSGGIQGAKEGKQAAKDLGDVLEAAGKITKAVVESKKQLEEVGSKSFIGWAWGFFKGNPLEASAETLRVMTPQTVLLAKAIIDMAQRMSGGIQGAKEGKQAAKDLGDVLESAGKITKAVVESKKQLEDIGSKSFIGWAWGFFRGNPLEEGAETLRVMTPQTVLLAKAIINMAKRMSGGVAGAKEGKQAAKDLADILESAGKIAKAVVDSKKKLEELTYMTSVSRWMSGILGRSEEAITNAAHGIISGIIVPIMRELPPGRDMGEARAKLRGCLDVLDQLPQFLNDLSQRMISLGQAKYLNYDLDSKTREFSEWFYTIGHSLAMGVIAPIMEGFPPAEALQGAGDSLDEMKNMLGKLEGFVNELAAKMIGFSNSWWWDYQAQMWSSTYIFAYFFQGIAWALGKGVAEPIIKYFPKADVIKAAADSTEEMGNLVMKVTRLTGILADRMMPFIGGWWWNSPIAKIAAKTWFFAAFFGGIASSLRWGVLEPITRNFPDSSEVEEATSTLSILVDALDGLMEVMDALTETLAELSSISIDFSALESVGGIFKSGKLELKIVAAAEDDTDGGSDSSEWMDKLLGVFTGIRSPAVSGNGGLLRGMRNGFGQAIEKPMGGVQKATGKVGSGVTRLGDTFSRFTQQSGDVPTRINQMKDLLHTDLVAILNQLRTQTTQQQQQGQQAQQPSHLATIATNTTQMNQTLTNISTIMSGVSTTLNNANAILTQIRTATQRSGNAQQSLEEEATSGSSLDTHDHTAERLLGRVIDKLENPRIPRLVEAEQHRQNQMLELQQQGQQRMLEIQRREAGEALVDASSALQSLEHEATSRASLDTHDHTMEDLMLNKVLPHVERLVAVSVAQEERAKTSTNNAEFDKQVQARVEQARPSDAMMTSMEYLAAIAANTAATNESVQEAVGVLEEIKNLMNADRGGESASPNTKPNSKPRGTPNYYAWQFGRFGDTAAKQYVNNGT